MGRKYKEIDFDGSEDHVKFAGDPITIPQGMSYSVCWVGPLLTRWDRAVLHNCGRPALVYRAPKWRITLTWLKMWFRETVRLGGNR